MGPGRAETLSGWGLVELGFPSGWGFVELGYWVGGAWPSWDAEWVGLCGRAGFLAFTSSKKYYL